MKDLQYPLTREGPRKWDRGFTLIELIGVLAVIAVLAALIIPNVMDIVGESNVTAFVSAAKTYERALLHYYKDIGSLLPLDAAGVPTAETTGNSAMATSLPARLTLSSSDPLVLTTGKWPQFHGPYVEHFRSSQPPGLGDAIYMPATTSIAYNATVTATNVGWDLDGNSEKNDLATGAAVVYLRITGVSQRDFLHLDNLLDGGVSLAFLGSEDLDTTQPPILATLLAGGGGGGPPPSATMVRGRVKYNLSQKTVLLYLASF